MTTLPRMVPGRILLPDVLLRSERATKTVPPSHTITVDLGFGNEPGGAFNPSIIEYKGRLLMAHRRSWVNAHLWLAELDRDTLQPKRVSPMRISRGVHDAASQEDQRLFLHRGKLHVSYTGVQQTETGVVTNVCLSSLEDEARGLWSPSWSPQYEGRNAWEKNWVFFEHDGELYAVYSVSPHRVLKFFHGGAEVAYETPFAPQWRYGHLRGGASPVLHNGEFYHFFHGQMNRAGHNWYYSAGLYTFDSKPPFAPKRFAKLPLLLPEMAEKPCEWVASVVYPGGAVYRNGVWLVAYGAFDTWCRIGVWTEEDIEGALRVI